MRFTRIPALILLASIIGCSTSSTPTPPTRAQDELYQRQTLAYLASDYLEGRGIGTKGLDTAALFIAEQYRKAGLVPLPGRSDYFQPFPYNLGVKVDPDKTSLVLGSVALKLDDDFRPNNLSARDKPFSGEVVFAGYGISSKQYKYDDFTNVDLKGKVALVLRYEPRTTTLQSRFTNSEEWSAEASVARKILAVQQRGATAVLLVNPPGTPADDALSPFSGRSGRSPVGIPVLQVSRAAVDQVLAARSLPTLDQLTTAIDSTGTPASRTLGSLSASGELKVVRSSAWIKNVIALLPGTGPNKDEYVVVGAHYDHLGFGGPGSLAGSVNAVHHGADDNGSGTTALLTLARRLAASPEKPNRSILFMSFTAEESGLIGSQYFVNNPLVPLPSITYMLNLDMVGRMKNNTLLHGGEGTAETLQPILDAAYAGTGLTAKSFGKGGIGPSDHASFARKRIPVLFLFTGLHTDYHRPSDIASRINYPGLLASTNVAERILRSLTSAPRSPYIVDADQSPQDVNRSDQFEPTTKPTTTPTPPAATNERVGLGLMPDMTTRDRGMRVDAVFPNSAAAKAGLKADDVILSLDNSPINSVEDLQAVYDKHKPGDEVELIYERANYKKNSIKVTFTRRANPQN